MQNNDNQQNQYHNDDEIDIFELIKTVWAYRVKIIAITTVFVALGLFYILVATLWFKASALVEMGYYKSTYEGVMIDIEVDKIESAVEKLKVTYIDLLEEVKDKEVVVKSITSVKNSNRFFNITVLGKSNEQATAKIKEIVDKLAATHKDVVDGYLSNQNVALANVDRKISFLKNNKIASLEDQINYLENVQIPRLNKQIKYMEDVVIPSAKRDVELVDSVTIPSVEKRISLSNSNIIKFEDELNNIRKMNHASNAANAVLSQMVEQTILGRVSSQQENLISLEQQKDTLISETKPKLQDKVYQLSNVEFVTLQAKKDAILGDKLPGLKRELANLQTEELGRLLDEKSIIELSLKPHSWQNTHIVSDIIVSEKADRPKKIIILAVSFVLGLLFAIFGVLVYDAYKKRLNLKEE